MVQKLGKILAIDYGSASIGLAVSDEARIMAFSRGVLRKLTKEEAISKVVALVNDEHIKLVILGLPMSAEGGETPQTSKIREFGDKLAQELSKLDVPLEYVDESFSSFEAQKMLENLNVKALDRKKTEDELAAVVLIRRYIDFRP